MLRAPGRGRRSPAVGDNESGLTLPRGETGTIAAMKSIFTVHVVKNLSSARRFYSEHFGMSVVFETSWYVHLHGPNPSIQLAFIVLGHESLPERYRNSRATGVAVSIEVDDAHAQARRCNEAGLELVYPLTDEPWGQRHFMLEDPNGLVVDVIEPIPPDADWLRTHANV